MSCIFITVRMSYTKYDATEHEYKIQDLIYQMGIINVPKVINFKQTEGRYGDLTMEKIPQMNISDMYGDSLSDIPDYIVEECRNIISILYKNHIEYPDITGYNFIEHKNKVYLVDFEHAKVNYDYNTYDPFILEFIEGCNTWNPYYA